MYVYPGAVIRRNSGGNNRFQSTSGSTDRNSYQGYSITSGRFLTTNREGELIDANTMQTITNSVSSLPYSRKIWWFRTCNRRIKNLSIYMSLHVYDDTKVDCIFICLLYRLCCITTKEKLILWNCKSLW